MLCSEHYGRRIVQYRRFQPQLLALSICLSPLSHQERCSCVYSQLSDCSDAMRTVTMNYLPPISAIVRRVSHRGQRPITWCCEGLKTTRCPAPTSKLGICEPACRLLLQRCSSTKRSNTRRTEPSLPFWAGQANEMCPAQNCKSGPVHLRKDEAMSG